MEGNAQLLELVATPHAGGSGTNLLDRWEQEPDENGDDGDYHQQFDECETFATHDNPSTKDMNDQ